MATKKDMETVVETVGAAAETVAEEVKKAAKKAAPKAAEAAEKAEKAVKKTVKETAEAAAETAEKAEKAVKKAVKETKELVKSGEEKASVEAVFQLSDGEAALDVLAEQGVDCEDGELTLYREFSLNGKNVCRANGTLINAAALKQIGDTLVDIHGQHAHQSLLDGKKHIVLLDRFAGRDALELKSRVSVAYHKASEARRQLNAVQFDEQERARRCDLLSYQIREIEGANLTIGEEEELEEQRDLLQNAQAVMEGLLRAAL